MRMTSTLDTRNALSGPLATALAALLCCSLGMTGPATAEDQPALPKSLADYRFVNAFIVHDQENPLFGMHEFYVNRVGLDAFRHGGPYPEGSEFIGLVYGVEKGDGTMNEGDAQAITLMRKVADAEATGGWQFAMYGADGKAMDIDVVRDCFECHTQVEQRDYVFSQPLSVGELSTVPATETGDASR